MVSNQLRGLLKILPLKLGIRERFVVVYSTVWSNQLSSISLTMKTFFQDNFQGQSLPQLSKDKRRHKTFRASLRIVMEPLWLYSPNDYTLSNYDTIQDAPTPQQINNNTTTIIAATYTNEYESSDIIHNNPSTGHNITTHRQPHQWHTTHVGAPHHIQQ